MNVVVLGNGAIGSLWTYHIKRFSTANVSIKTRSALCIGTATDTANGTYARKNSLSFTCFHGLSLQIEYTLADQQNLQNADLIISCLKSTETASALNSLSHLLSNNVDIVLCHNGLGVYEALSDELKLNNRIYAMLTTHGCFRASKHHVIHTGLGHCDVGLLTSPVDKKSDKKNQQPAWLELLNHSLPSVYWSDDIKTKQWLKLAINCVINPITAIHKINNGKVTENVFRQQIEAVAEEVSIAAHTQGIQLVPQDIVSTSLEVAKKTSKNTSSMLSDVLANRETEITNINGYICELAKQYGFSAKANQSLFEQVKSLSV